MVKNEGGRAGCQDDWFTFSIMRKSQYLTWDKGMLLQYCYDFDREMERGHGQQLQQFLMTAQSARALRQPFIVRRELSLHIIDYFQREMERGHNLIEEKYGRMMESTAPEKYAEMKARFPEITSEKKQIIERIVALQVAWMEEFAATSLPAIRSSIAVGNFMSFLFISIIIYTSRSLCAALRPHPPGSHNRTFAQNCS